MLGYQMSLFFKYNFTLLNLTNKKMNNIILSLENCLPDILFHIYKITLKKNKIVETPNLASEYCGVWSVKIPER